MRHSWIWPAHFWGTGAGKLLAVFASISAFGALNGWILLQGELPSAMAKRGEFPRIFARESSHRSPSFGLCFGSALVTLLIVANYQKSMVKVFTFMILLSTTACLVLYAVCSLALLRLQWKGQLQGARSGSVPLAIVGILATAYSLWAIVGAGAEAVIWGAVLLALGCAAVFLVHTEFALMPMWRSFVAVAVGGALGCSVPLVSCDLS